MIRPTIETALAALLLAISPFLLVFGPNGVLNVAYHATRSLPIWGTTPPEVAADWDVQATMALVALLLGAFFFIGVWAGHPRWRKALLVSTAFVTVWIVWTLAQVGVF